MRNAKSDFPVGMPQHSGPGYRTALVLIGCCVLCWIVGIRTPELTGVVVRLAADRTMFLWPFPARVILFGVCCGVLSVTAGWVTRLAMDKARNDPDGHPSLAYVLQPLAFLPFSLFPLLLRPGLPSVLVGNVFFFLPVFVGSLAVSRAVRVWGPKLDRQVLDWRIVLGTLIFATFFFWGSGLRFTKIIGPHSGDEGHYLIQAESLYRDHDLDLTNNLPRKRPLTPERKTYLHISELSRNGKAYSWHPFGLSLLLAPTVPGGDLPRHLVLGLISGVGCAGMLVLCRLFGSGTCASLLVSGFFVFSTFWGVYSSRALPEVLGASLLVGLTICLVAVDRHPVFCSLVGGLCCAYLPWAHARFIPPGIVAAGAFVTVCLVRPGSWSSRMMRLFPFSTICAISGVLYLYIQHRMFESGSVYTPATGRILDEPVGPWHVLASSRGILYSLPMFAGLLAGCLLTLVADPARRWLLVYIVLCLIIVLATACTTPWYAGGASLPGRFLFIVVPLLIPAAALAFERAGERGQTWFIFLGLTSCAQFILLLVSLDKTGKDFTTPVETLREVVTPLAGLVQPLQPPESATWHPFALLLYVTTAYLMIPESSKTFFRYVQRLVGGVLVCSLAVLAVVCNSPAVSGRLRPEVVENARKLSAFDLERAWIRCGGATTNAIPLLSVSNLLRGHLSPEGLVINCGEAYPAGDRGGSVSGPTCLELNGHAVAWTPVVPEFQAGRGARVFRFTAQVEGECRLVLAVREGHQMLAEEHPVPDPAGNVTVCRILRCEGYGPVSLLVRVEGTRGTIRIKNVEWSPVARRLLTAASLSLPMDCTVCADRIR